MPILCVDKPLGLTSHDVVARVRRALGTRRVGHAGTLDPLATGVLLVLVGEATKLSDYLRGHDKRYLAWVSFGAGTDTLDAEGPVSARADASGLTMAAVQHALVPFLSLTSQRPPAYSAIKQGGERSYRAARRGELVEPPARPVAYREVCLLGFGPTRDSLAPGRRAERGAALARSHLKPQAAAAAFEPLAGRSLELPPTLGDNPTALLDLTVAAGTYVRALARDLGGALGLPAHLSGLVRTASGAVPLSRAARLEEVGSAEVVSPTLALDLPVVALSDAQVEAVRHGKRLTMPLAARSVLVDEKGGLVAIAEPAGPEPAADAADGVGTHLGAGDGTAAKEDPVIARMLRVFNPD